MTCQPTQTPAASVDRHSGAAGEVPPRARRAHHPGGHEPVRAHDRRGGRSRRAAHIAHIVKEALARGATAVEPSQEAQDAWVSHVHETAFDISQFPRECTPSYFNGEGTQRWYAGEPYGPGWFAFEKLLEDRRNAGDLEGMELTSGAASAKMEHV